MKMYDMGRAARVGDSVVGLKSTDLGEAWGEFRVVVGLRERYIGRTYRSLDQGDAFSSRAVQR